MYDINKLIARRCGEIKKNIIFSYVANNKPGQIGEFAEGCVMMTRPFLGNHLGTGTSILTNLNCTSISCASLSMDGRYTLSRTE